MFNILTLLFAQFSGSHRVHPRRYLHASQETIVVALIVTWAVTLIWYPDEAWKHPKYITLGAFNFCFGWYAATSSPFRTHRPLASHRAFALLRDFPPGNYIGLFMCSVMVYFLWRYAILVNMRRKMHRAPEWVDVGAAFWTYLHAVSASCFLLIWLVGPISAYDGPIHIPKLGLLPGPEEEQESAPTWSYHTYAFLCLIFASYFSYVFAYLESRLGTHKTVKPVHTYYIIAFGISVVFFLYIYVTQNSHETSGAFGKNHPDAEECKEQPRSVPGSFFIADQVHCSYLSGQWTIVANWFWFFCWLAAPYFTPSEPAITESYRFADVLEDEDEATLAGIQMH